MFYEGIDGTLWNASGRKGKHLRAQYANPWEMLAAALTGFDILQQKLTTTVVVWSPILKQKLTIVIIVIKKLLHVKRDWIKQGKIIF